MKVDEIEEAPSTGLNALTERTADLTEDIEEYAEVAQAVLAEEAAEKVEEDTTDVEEETV